MQAITTYIKQSWQYLLLNAAILWIATYAFFGLAEEVWERETLAWDNQIALALHSLSSPLLDRIMTFITWSGFQLAIPLTLLLVGWFWWQQERRRAVFAVVAVAGAALTGVLLKAIFQRPRPTIFTPLFVETSYSFPSGHTLTAVGLYGFVAILLWRSGRRGWAIVSALWAVLVGISRIYLGVHYPSDVLASFAVGTIWLLVVAYQYDQTQKKEKSDAITG